MRTLFFILIVAAFGLLSCNGRLAPDPVHKAFMERFKDAKDVKWNHEEQKWEADFTSQGKKMVATFDEKGIWLKTDCCIDVADLPAGVRDSILVGYEGYDIDEVHQIETPEFKGYIVVVEKADEELEILADDYHVIRAGKHIEDYSVPQELIIPVEPDTMDVDADTDDDSGDDIDEDDGEDDDNEKNEQ